MVGAGWQMLAAHPPCEHYAEKIGGWVATPHGFVGVFSRRKANGDEATQMKVITGGKQHTRVWEKVYSKKYLHILAKRFAQEMAEG